MALTVGYNKREKASAAPMVDMWESIPMGYNWDISRPYECEAKKVEFISADGPELEAIQLKFKNLPIVEGFCIWEGEMANFIHANLKHLTK